MPSNHTVMIMLPERGTDVKETAANGICRCDEGEGECAGVQERPPSGAQVEGGPGSGAESKKQEAT